MGPEAGTLGPRVWDLTEAQKARVRDAAKLETKLANRLAKVRAKQRRIKRAAEVAAIKLQDLSDIIDFMRSWLDVFYARASSLGHQSGMTKATNRDGTADVQLMMRDWSPPYSQAFFKLEDGMTELLPVLPSGVKVRVQIRLKGKSDGSKASVVKYGYLPTVMGEQTVYFNYVDPRLVGQLLYKVENKVDVLTKNTGYDLAAVVLDVRFDPRWRKET